MRLSQRKGRQQERRAAKERLHAVTVGTVTQNPRSSFTPTQGKSFPQRPLWSLQQYNSPALCPPPQLPSQLAFQSLTFCLPPDCEQWAPFPVMLLHVPASSPSFCLLPHVIRQSFSPLLIQFLPSFAVLLGLFHTLHTEWYLDKPLDLPTDETICSCMVLFWFYLRHAG